MKQPDTSTLVNYPRPAISFGVTALSSAVYLLVSLPWCARRG